MAMWTIIAFGCILTLRFMWLLLVSVALALNAINVVGYVKCKRFFNTGRCTFAEGQLGCCHFPCKPEYSERDGAVRMLLDSIK